MEGSGTNLRLPFNPPVASERDAQYVQPNPTIPTSLLPGSTLSDGFAAIGSVSNPFKGANIRLWDPNVRPAASHEWNFTVQQQFGHATTAQIGYVGQKNDHLIVAQPYKQGILNPNGTITKTPYLSGNPTVYNAIGQISGTEANGNMSYNALQATLGQRLTHGLQANFSYTWSKCMTDSIGFYGSGGGASAATSAYVQNLYNRKAEWGPCGWDAEHIFTGYVSYDLPFGHGRAFGKNINRFADAFVGGWQVNSVMSFHTGFPLTINNATTDPSGTGARSSRANCIAPAERFGQTECKRERRRFSVVRYVQFYRRSCGYIRYVRSRDDTWPGPLYGRPQPQQEIQSHGITEPGVPRRIHQCVQPPDPECAHSHRWQCHLRSDPELTGCPEYSVWVEVQLLIFTDPWGVAQRRGALLRVGS